MVNQEDKSTFIQEIVEGTEDTIIDEVLEIIEEKVNKEFGIRLDKLLIAHLQTPRSFGIDLHYH